MTILVCPTCKETYIMDDGEKPLCPACKIELNEICEWCNQPEKDCHCGKDEIPVE